MKKYIIYAHRVHHSIRLVVTLFVLLVFLVQNVAGSVYMSLLMQSYTTVTSPPVILQNGTASTSTIYTNSTSAKVSLSGYGYDYVDNNDTNVDLSADKGTYSNFTAQKYGPDLINDTLTEESASVNTLELWVDGYDGAKSDWTEIGTTPYLSSVNYPTDYITTDATGATEEFFDFTNASSTGTINDVKICVYARNLEGDDGILGIFVYNSTGRNEIASPTPSDTAWAWYNYSCLSVLPTWTEVNGSRLRVTCTKVGGDDTLFVDAALIFVNNTSINYELDLEIQWTSVDFDETYEELCIKTGTFSGSEDIMVYAWNVSASDWHFLYNLTASNWNNFSVADWLNNGNFTIRFLGGTENSDTAQDSWDIDATLLHIWTETDYVYDYVFRVNNTDTDPWEIRLKKYSDANIGRLQNCTIYFHNSSDGTSRQIYIQNGLYINQTGPWYDLGDSETIYIAMTAEANSTATSYVYTSLEILIPGTTTYAQYIIMFEIT